jgi:hypothetical protein
LHADLFQYARFLRVLRLKRNPTRLYLSGPGTGHQRGLLNFKRWAQLSNGSYPHEIVPSSAGTMREVG